MNGCLRRAALGCGGLLLASALLALFAWQLFPADFFGKLPERLLNRVLPQYQWRVGTARCVWPGVVTLEGVEAAPPGLGASLRLDSLDLRPDWRHWLRTRGKRGAFAARLAGGAVDGTAGLSPEAPRRIEVSARFQDIDLAVLTPLAHMLGRDLRGRVGGRIAATLDAATGTAAALKADLTARDGTIPLRNPVLGHDTLPFAAISARIEQRDGTWQLRDGALDSPLGTGSFAGTLTPTRPLAAGRIDIAGALRPGPALFAHVRDEPEFQALRLGLGDGGLRVTLSGALADPALAFGPGEE